MLNLVQQNQFSGLPNEDATLHVQVLLELCDMSKVVESNTIKSKLFLISLRSNAKEWLLSLPAGNINSCQACALTFLSKYYSPAKIVYLLEKPNYGF